MVLTIRPSDHVTPSSLPWRPFLPAQSLSMCRIALLTGNESLGANRRPARRNLAASQGTQLPSAVIIMSKKTDHVVQTG
jgi:hypothetical protein